VILMAALTALASRKMASAVAPSEAAKPLWRSLFLLSAVATLLMMRITSPVWTVLPKLRFVQFPWRWTSVVAVIGCCSLAAAAERRRGWLWFAVYVVLAVPLAQFLVHNTWWDPDEMTTQQAALSTGKGYEGVDEYDPLGDDHLDLPKQAPVLHLLAESSNDPAATPPAGTVVAWLPNEKWVRTDSSTPARLALRLLNYPAWRVTVNDRVVQPERPDDTNQMVIPIPAGHAQIKVVFTRTPDRTTGIALSLLSLLIAVLLFRL